jgi:hypothetical protein
MVKTTAYMLSPNEAFNGILWALSKIFCQLNSKPKNFWDARFLAKTACCQGFGFWPKKFWN